MATGIAISPALKLQNAVTDSGGHTLTIGAAGSPSGLILDGGSIAAGTLAFNSEAVIYATAQNGTITWVGPTALSVMASTFCN